MRVFLHVIILSFATLTLPGCSVFGHSGVEVAPYRVLEKEQAFELRHYERLVLVTTKMSGLSEQRSPFSKLFDYISGDNDVSGSIPMTAPVFMDQGDNQSETMSFVLPADISLEAAPVPKDPSVRLEELTDYTVAAITFNGRLQQENISAHKAQLEEWIAKKQYKITGPAKAAGYNPPFTLPHLRRNEVLIPVKARHLQK
jgi:hypothetical protein